MATKQKPQKRRNPAAAGAREEAPFPFLDPDYPIKPWVNPVTGMQFRTIAVLLDDGTYLASVAEYPTVRATAKTRAAAEKAVLRQMQTRRANPEELEGSEAEEVKRIIEERKGVPTIPWREWMKKYA